MRLNSTTCAIVGVLPAEFAGTEPILGPELWVPAVLWPALSGGAAATLDAKDSRAFAVVARLRGRATLAQADAEVAALGASLAERNPDTHQEWRLVAENEQDARRRRLGGIGTVSLVAVNLVLLLACANVAGLLLGRAESRRPEGSPCASPSAPAGGASSASCSPSRCSSRWPARRPARCSGSGC